MKYIKSKLSRTVRNEKGSIMLYVLIFMLFFLPFAIWVGVQLPVKFEYTYAIKESTSNIADSMVSRIDKDSLAKGILWIDESEANDVGERMVKTAFQLDDAFDPSGEGVLRENIPYVFKSFTDLSELDEYFTEVNGKYQLPEDVGVFAYVFNGIPEGTIVHFENILPVQKPSVIVRANIPVENGGLLGGRAVITKTGFSEVEIHTGESS